MEWCCFDCKSTKNLRAIHNNLNKSQRTLTVVSTAKVQKIWEQFTTCLSLLQVHQVLFRLQKYKKFESNSQRDVQPIPRVSRCFDCKSTKNLRAIHNFHIYKGEQSAVVSTAKVQKIWEQFTTVSSNSPWSMKLFRLQKYKKFESNSQLAWWRNGQFGGCFDCKSTKNLRAIHNILTNEVIAEWVVSTAKVQKIWEQFTTRSCRLRPKRKLFRLQKYKKFESNSQLDEKTMSINACCFDCKSTKNLRAIHN